MLVAYWVQFTRQKDIFNYQKAVGEYDFSVVEGLQTIDFAFIGLLIWIDTNVPINFGIVLNSFIAIILGLFFTRLIKNPWEFLLMAIIVLSPTITDNFRGIMRQGFALALFVIGFMIPIKTLTGKTFKGLFYVVSAFFHQIILIPLAAMFTAFLYRKISVRIGLKPLQASVVYSFFGVVVGLTLFLLLANNALNVGELSKGVEQGKSGLGFMFFSATLIYLIYSRRLSIQPYYYEAFFIILVVTSFYFVMAGSLRFLSVGFPLIAMFFMNLEKPEDKYFFLVLFSIHSVTRIILSTGYNLI